MVRTEGGLEAGIKALEGLKKEKIASDESGIAFALETENLIHVAEMVLRACLTRKESRGPHLFFGHFDEPQPLPSQDPKWRKYIVIRNRMGKDGPGKEDTDKIKVDLKSLIKIDAVGAKTNMKLEMLPQPIKIGNRLAPNRMVNQPMECNDADATGHPTDLTFKRYRKLAEGEAGIIAVESLTITYETRSRKNQLKNLRRDGSGF